MSSNKRVLIITYYWPPSGGAGVQRWVRFVSQLRNFGWEPVLCIPEDPKYVVEDPSLINSLPADLEVIYTPLWDPIRFVSKLRGANKKEGNQLKLMQKPAKNDWKAKLLWKIRGNFFIPDAKRFWIKPSVKKLSAYLKEYPVDAIVSTGPPHSAHLIALGLKSQFNIPWLADFRDPWISMDYLQEMGLGKRAWKKHERLEMDVITKADEVVVVGRTMQLEFMERYGRECDVIYNGFNVSNTAEPKKYELDSKFTIVHIGNLLRDRNCRDLWQVMSELIKENEDFRTKIQLKFIGELAVNVRESLTEFGLDEYSTFISYIPFEETQSHLHQAQVLLLPIDRISNAAFVLTGKLFEYIKSKRPILLLGPSNGDAADIVTSCQSGMVCDFDDFPQLRKTILEMFDRFNKGTNFIDPIDIDRFSTPKLTAKMAELLSKNLPKENN